MKKYRNLIRLPEVKRRAGVGTSYIYKAMREGKFPLLCKIGRLSAWDESEVAAWVEQRLSERNT